MSDLCEHETFKDICPICHRDGMIDKLKAAGLHQTSAKILEQAVRIEQLEKALEQAANDLDDWGAYTKANNARTFLRKN